MPFISLLFSKQHYVSNRFDNKKLKIKEKAVLSCSLVVAFVVCLWLSCWNWLNYNLGFLKVTKIAQICGIPSNILFSMLVFSSQFWIMLYSWFVTCTSYNHFMGECFGLRMLWMFRRMIQISKCCSALFRYLCNLIV